MCSSAGFHPVFSGGGKYKESALNDNSASLSDAHKVASCTISNAT